MAKVKTSTKNNSELSAKTGTIAYAVVKNKTELNEICSETSMNIEEQKQRVIDILEADSKDCQSRGRIFGIIRKIKTSMDLLMYLYNLILAGDGMEVIQI